MANPQTPETDAVPTGHTAPTLWDAFRAGFEASGEGWNGEYPEDLPETDVRQSFEA